MIWLLERRRGPNRRDEATAFVVQADREDEARAFAARRCGDEGPYVWRDSTETSCVAVTDDYPPGVVLRDFFGG